MLESEYFEVAEKHPKISHTNGQRVDDGELANLQIGLS